MWGPGWLPSSKERDLAEAEPWAALQLTKTRAGQGRGRGRVPGRVAQCPGQEPHTRAPHQPKDQGPRTHQRPGQRPEQHSPPDPEGPQAQLAGCASQDHRRCPAPTRCQNQQETGVGEDEGQLGPHATGAVLGQSVADVCPRAVRTHHTKAHVPRAHHSATHGSLS